MLVFIGAFAAVGFDDDVGGAVVLVNLNVVVSLHAACAVAVGNDVERAAADGEGAVGVERLGVLVVHRQVESVALNLHLFTHLDGVAYGLGDVERAERLGHTQVFLHVDAVGGVALDGQLAVARELHVAPAVEAALVGAAGSVLKIVHGALRESHGDAFAALDVDGGAL